MVRRFVQVAAFGLAAFLAVVVPARSQTQLPEIRVTAPSPIVPPRPRSAATPTQTTAPAEPEPQPSIIEYSYSSVTVMTAPELERTPGSTIGDLLFAKPGITASTFAPGAASRPIVRGLDNFRVRLQEIGVATMDVSDLGEDHGVPIDPLAAQRIEVIRGPATLRWGSTAIGGVVEVANNRIPDVLGPPGLTTTSKGAVTSVDAGIEGALLMDAVFKNIAFHADFYGRSASDYRIPGGTQLNTALRSAGQAVGGSIFFDGGFVGLALVHFASLYHVPGTDAAATNTRIDMRQTKLLGRGEWRPEFWAVEAVRFWFGVSNYVHDELGLDAGVDEVRATFKNLQQELRVETQFVPLATAFGPLTGAFGLQFGNQNLGTSGEAGTLLAPNHTMTFAAYLFEELKLSDTVRLQAAGRIEDARVTGTGAMFPADLLGPSGPAADFPVSREFLPKSFGLALLKQLPWGLIASINGQYAERAPRAPELLSKGAHDAPGTFEIGNPSLTIEAARSLEVGLRRPRGAWRFDATAYYTKYRGFIYKALTGNKCGDTFDTCGVEDELTQVVYSQRDATFYGVELQSELDLLQLAGGIFGLHGQYDFVHARFADGTSVPRIPPHRLGGGLYWRDARWLLRVGLLHAFAQNEIAPNETPTPGYNLLRAELTYSRPLPGPLSAGREMVLGLVADNLLNDDIRNHVSFRKDEVLLPGRNVRLFAKFRF